jgi:hypothetical protein
MQEHRKPEAEPLTLIIRVDPATENGGDDRTATSMKHAEDGSRILADGKDDAEKGLMECGQG